MSTRSRTSVTSLAFAALSVLSVLSIPCAQAQSTEQSAEPPGRVGRVALTQGQVRIAAGPGIEASAAQVNWPVTTGSTITTAAGARTELRIGSTAIRLDGDSSLEVLALDDDTLQLRLHYGSASVRVMNQDTLAGFALETPQAQVRLQQPGRVRVDAERVRDTSAVTVFEGTASVEGGGSQLTVRAGRRAEVGDEDVGTLAAIRDAFDDWTVQRDRVQEAPAAARYVGTEMTGYEELDRHGSWRVDDDYGPLWTPNVAAGWVPYRDGSWTWLEPWGWTWVDNAPWGYAPFHYGRWVQVRNRWAWAPGGHAGRPVWAPALVGWVGGGGWNATFRDRHREPALGWYPLSPWDRYTPSYRAREDHLRWLNGHVREHGRPRDYRPQGLTVVPQDRFNRPGRVNVPRAPIATVPPVLVRDLPAGAPPVPRQARIGVPGRAWVGRTGDEERGRPGRDGRIDTARVDQDGVARGGFWRGRPQAPAAPQPLTTAPGLVPPAAPVQPLPVTSPTPRLPNQPLPVTSPTPRPGQPVPDQPGQGWQGRPGRDRDRDWRDRDRDGGAGRPGDSGDWRRNRQPQPVAQAPQPQPQPPAVLTTAPPTPQPRFEPRPDRPDRGWNRGRDADGFAGNGMPARPAPQPAPQPVMTAPPRPMPLPVVAAPPPRPAPQPVMAPPPPPQPPAPRAAPAAQPAPASRPEAGRHAQGAQRGMRQQER